MYILSQTRVKCDFSAKRLIRRIPFLTEKNYEHPESSRAIVAYENAKEEEGEFLKLDYLPIWTIESV